MRIASQHIRTRVAGTLRAGQRLVIRDLSQRFQVSSTPIREALIQLEAIGVIDFIPNAGAVVRRVTKEDVKEVCQVRKYPLATFPQRGHVGFHVAPRPVESASITHRSTHNRKFVEGQMLAVIQQDRRRTMSQNLFVGMSD